MKWSMCSIFNGALPAQGAKSSTRGKLCKAKMEEVSLPTNFENRSELQILGAATTKEGSPIQTNAGNQETNQVDEARTFLH